MSKLTAEAILNELGKLKDNTGRAMSFADGQTIVPNTLLTQVWEEAERQERERIIQMLEDDLDVLPEFARAIELIKGEQK